MHTIITEDNRLLRLSAPMKCINMCHFTLIKSDTVCESFNSKTLAHKRYVHFIIPSGSFPASFLPETAPGTALFIFVSLVEQRQLYSLAVVILSFGVLE